MRCSKNHIKGKDVLIRDSFKFFIATKCSRVVK
jgi:hypothetical protein